MNILPDRSHLDKARDTINQRLMVLIENDKELNLVDLLASYHVDLDVYIESLERITIESQEDYLKVKENLKSLKKSYDMVLDAYKKTSDQEVKNIKCILKHDKQRRTRKSKIKDKD